MNILPIENGVQIINLLVEGSSLLATSRITGVSIKAVSKPLVDVARACIVFHDEMIRNVATKRIHCDEIWSFVYSKDKNIPEGMEGKTGNVWTLVGIDSDTKLVISWMIGSRDAGTPKMFMKDAVNMLATGCNLLLMDTNRICRQLFF